MVYPGLWLWLWGGDWVWRACGEKAVHGASGARGTLTLIPAGALSAKGAVSTRMKGKPKEGERMVKKYVIYLGQVVYEDGAKVTGNDQLWIHKDEKTWKDYDATNQALMGAGFVPFDSLGDFIDKQLRDEKKDD